VYCKLDFSLILFSVVFSNTDVSRLLGEMWRNASAAERAPYIEDEERERAAYKEDIRRFREEQAKIDSSTRRSHREVTITHSDESSLQNTFQMPPLDDNVLPSDPYRHYGPPPMVEVKHGHQYHDQYKYRSYENNIVDYGRHADNRMYKLYSSQSGDDPLNPSSRSARSYSGHHGHQYSNHHPQPQQQQQQQQPHHQSSYRPVFYSGKSVLIVQGSCPSCACLLGLSLSILHHTPCITHTSLDRKYTRREQTTIIESRTIS
jgi:HMG (high mobility group) box